MKLKLILPALCALVLAGCGETDDTLRVVTNATFPPYEFVNDHHEIVGVDVEICRAVAQKLRRPLKVTTIEFDEVIPSVAAGKADLAAAGLTITEKRMEHVDFSMPYMKTGIVIIHNRNGSITSVAACRGKRVGVQGGTTSEAFVLEKLHQEPVRFASHEEAVAALKNGRVNCVIADIDPARNSVKTSHDLEITGFITSEEYAVALAKHNPKLLKVVDETIAELKASGQIQKWFDAYTAEAARLNVK